MKNLFFLASAFAILIAPAAAADQQLRVRGTIASLSGPTLVVNTAGGAPVNVALDDNARVSIVVKADLASIVPGSYVGAVSAPEPDGTIRAIAINIFPGNKGPAEGSRPWDLTPTSTMTNANVSAAAVQRVDNVDARVLTLTYKDGEKKIVVPPGTPIVTTIPGERSALVPGGKVTVFAVKHDDDGYSAANVLVGKDGLTPPN